jgi:hypothetical protein
MNHGERYVKLSSRIMLSSVMTLMKPYSQYFLHHQHQKPGNHHDKRRPCKDACERCGRLNHSQSRCCLHRHSDGKTLLDPPPITRPWNQSQSNSANNLHKTGNSRKDKPQAAALEPRITKSYQGHPAGHITFTSP